MKALRDYGKVQGLRGLGMDGETLQERVYKAGEDGWQMDTTETTVSEGGNQQGRMMHKVEWYSLIMD